MQEKYPFPATRRAFREVFVTPPPLPASTYCSWLRAWCNISLNGTIYPGMDYGDIWSCLTTNSERKEHHCCLSFCFEGEVETSSQSSGEPSTTIGSSGMTTHISTQSPTTTCATLACQNDGTFASDRCECVCTSEYQGDLCQRKVYQHSSSIVRRNQNEGVKRGGFFWYGCQHSIRIISLGPV